LGFIVGLGLKGLDSWDGTPFARAVICPAFNGRRGAKRGFQGILEFLQAVSESLAVMARSMNPTVTILKMPQNTRGGIVHKVMTRLALGLGSWI
jgi:hypothetical protein